MSIKNHIRLFFRRGMTLKIEQPKLKQTVKFKVMDNEVYIKGIDY